MVGRGWPTTSKLEFGLRRRVTGACRHLDRKFAGIDRGRRPHLELHVLGGAGVDRHRRQLLRAIGLGEGGLEIARRGRSEAHDEIAAAVVLDARACSRSSIFGVPRSDGSCGVTASFAGSSLARLTVIGRLTLFAGFSGQSALHRQGLVAAAGIGRNVEAQAEG